jgi:hypothetical protein
VSINIRLCLVAMLLAAGLSAVISCSERDKRPAARDARERLRPTDEQTMAGIRLHGQDGTHLHDVMNELARHTAYAPTNDLPADPESNKSVDPRTFEDVYALSQQLADAAARIPPAANDIRMFNDERTVFDQQAADLRRDSLDLGAAAKAHNVERMQRTFDRINHSCVECHTRFGDFAGPIESIGAPSASQSREAQGPGDPAAPRVPGDAR